ncbi:MAG: hypothetical protein P4L36_09285 [Holophaga sp.]|nr:hypothetical protein [Holophaga sp.]
MRTDRGAGAVALLAAFMLLTLLAGVGFATSRNLIRELPMGGNAQRGAEAAAAAESGLAWFLAWCGSADGRQALDSGQEPALAPGLLPETPGSRFRQSFQLRIQLLGALPRPGDAPGAPTERLWLATAVGRSALEGEDRSGFVHVRELLVAVPAPVPPEVPATGGLPGPSNATPGLPPAGPSAPDRPGDPGPDPPRNLRILAWRTEIPGL